MLLTIIHRVHKQYIFDFEKFPVSSGCCWAVVLVVGGGVVVVVVLVVVLGTGNVPEIKNNTENVGNK
jgi:hypothetical protein